MTRLPALPRRVPRWPRLALVLLLVAWTALGWSAMGWSAAPAQADAPQSWVSVTLGSVSPAVPGPDATVHLTGTVTNTSDITLYNVQAMICRSYQSPITDADGLAAVLAGDAASPPCFRITDFGTFSQLTRGSDPATKNLPPSLAPGASLQFSVHATMQQFTFPPVPGIYVVGIHLMGRTEGPRSQDHVLGRARTFLPVGVSTFRPAQPATVASAVVLAAKPTVIRPGVFSDDSLARAISSNGELGRLLALGDSGHYTFLVDPALVAAVRMLAHGYQVEHGGRLTAHPASTVAQAWLRRLEALPGDRLYRLPYAHPDLAALAHTGHQDLYHPRLGADVLPGRDVVVLPAGGFADAATLSLASRSGAVAVLLAGPSSGGDAAVAAGPDGVPVVSYAADAMDGGPAPDPRTTPTQIRQRFLADTYLSARTGQDTAIVRLITTSQQAASLPHADAPWLATTTLRDLLAAAPASSPYRPSYPPSAAKRELTASQVDAVAALARGLRTYAALTSGTATLDAAGQQAIARALSSSWRSDPEGLRAFVAAQGAPSDAALDGGKLHLGKHSNVVLSGKKGPTSVTVVNGLAVPVTVNVHFTSGNALRLAVKDLTGKQIPAHSSRSFLVEITPRANGEVPVSAQLETTTGIPVGKPISFIVHATQYGVLGWIIAVGAAIVLFVSTFLRIRQVRREKAKFGEPAGPDDSDRP